MTKGESTLSLLRLERKIDKDKKAVPTSLVVDFHFISLESALEDHKSS